MERELSRLATFVSFPAEANVSPLTLARCGFCYDERNLTIRCVACGAKFDPAKHSSEGILKSHREQSPHCHFVLTALTPEVPPNLPRVVLSVGGGGRTESDVGSQIHPVDELNEAADESKQILLRTFNSALARATEQGVFQHSSERILVRGREQFFITASTPNAPPNQPISALSVGGVGRTESDVGSQIHPVDELNEAADESTQILHTFTSALARTTERAVLQTTARDQSMTVSAVMDREEVSILIPIILNLGFSVNDLRNLVTERLLQGDDCLSPRALVEALLEKQRL